MCWKKNKLLPVCWISVKTWDDGSQLCIKNDCYKLLKPYIRVVVKSRQFCLNMLFPCRNETRYLLFFGYYGTWRSLNQQTNKEVTNTLGDHRRLNDKTNSNMHNFPWPCMSCRAHAGPTHQISCIESKVFCGVFCEDKCRFFSEPSNLRKKKWILMSGPTLSLYKP